MQRSRRTVRASGATEDETLGVAIIELNILLAEAIDGALEASEASPSMVIGVVRRDMILGMILMIITT